MSTRVGIGARLERDKERDRERDRERERGRDRDKGGGEGESGNLRICNRGGSEEAKRGAAPTSNQQPQQPQGSTPQ